LRDIICDNSEIALLEPTNESPVVIHHSDREGYCVVTLLRRFYIIEVWNAGQNKELEQDTTDTYCPSEKSHRVRAKSDQIIVGND